MTILRTNTIAGIGETFGPLFDGDFDFNSQNYVILPKGTASQSGVLRDITDVVGAGRTFYDNLVLAMPFNAATGLTDVSSRNRNPAAYGNVSISSTISKYYGSSAKFDGNGDYLELVNNTDFQFGIGDWSIEFWWNGQPTGSYTSQISTLISSFESGTWRVGTRFDSGNEIYFSRGTGSAFTDVRFTVNVNDGNWHHIAFVRYSGTIIPFVDGINKTANLLSGSVSDSNSMTTTNPVKIGYNSRDNAYINGFLQDLRIYKGIAKYTANFTPPDRIAEVGVGFKSGALRYNTDSSKVELYDGSQWTEVQSSRPDLNGGARGIFAGGSSSNINYVNISSAGNAISFGSLTVTSYEGSGCSSSTRGCFAIGYGPAANSNIIEYITISSTGNSADFGDLAMGAARPTGSCSSATRGLFCSSESPASINNIDYITIASIGNAADFGDLTRTSANARGCSSPTRGLFGGGRTQPTAAGVNIIDFVTIATLGNAIDFGDLTRTETAYGSSCANATRGIWAGGGPSASNIIDYITIATLGNAIDFGDLTAGRQAMCGGASSSTRGLFAGGQNPGATNIIDYITISTQGNAVDFGDLTWTSLTGSSFSNAHGGL